MLTTTQIQNINVSMLGLGAPIERDGVGYNKPDFMNMESYGLLNTELSFAESYVVLMALSHYKNSQLKDIKTEIEETITHFEDEIKQMGVDSLDIIRQATDANHPKSDYNKRYLYFYGVKNGSAIVGFREYIDGVNIRQFGGMWCKSASTGRTAIKIPMESMNAFLEYVSDLGMHGYQATDDLLKAIADYKPEIKIVEPFKLTATGKKNQYGHMLFELNFNNYAFVQKLWNLKGSGVKYIDSKSDSNRVIISTTPEMLITLIDYLAGEGIDVSEIQISETKCESNPVGKNASGISLVDPATLDLPFNPYQFQIDDAAAAVQHKHFMFGHDMGCGKTLMAIMVGLSIKGRKLVICPETLRLNWRREILQARNGADVRIVYSKDKEPKFDAEWTIIGYKTAVKFAGLLMDAHFDCMFVDEAHKCKAVNNYGKPNSRQAAVVMELAKITEYVYLLTGTPMPTRNKDLYNELVMLGEIDGSKKWSFLNYAKQFCDGHRTAYGFDANGSSNSGELHRMLSKYMVRRLKSDVLPNLTKQRIPVVIESKLSKDYKDIEKRLYNMDENDTYMGLAMSGRRYLSKCKLDSAIEFAEDIVESDESVVIVTEFDETLDALMEHFGDNACCIRGGMSDTAKQKAIDAFQSGEKKVCCINLIAAGVGITLTKAHNMVIIDYDWTPANMTQVEDRICRTGQNQHCNIYYIIHDEAVLDQVFLEMITAKSENIDRVVDDAENTVDLLEMRKNASNGDFFTRLKRKCTIK